MLQRTLLLLVLLVLSLSVTACAGTKVQLVTSYPPVTTVAPPHTISVVVENDSPPPEKPEKRDAQLADAKKTAADLTTSLSKLLVSHKLAVVPPGHPADLELLCRIAALRGGNKALRMVIGYGAGKAVLQMDVALKEPRPQGESDLLTFETRGTTGAMPGGGFKATSLAIDGVKSFRKDGLPKEIDQVTDDIDKELGKYFLAQHWAYPKAP